MGAAGELPVTFGRYVLRRKLAEGGMAEIFLAEQRGAADVSKTVVLKRMLPHLGREPGYVKMFLDEARLASKLSHPNVVQVFDFGEVDGRYFLAMEYLAGENVGAILRKCRDRGGQVPVPVVLRIVADACDGLHYAHEYAEGGTPMNIVHRDVTPANVMLTYQGTVKVVDFGIARARDRLQERTATGVVKGKLAYCAPEQFRDAEVDRRADLFSLGVVLWEMATVERLFRRRTDEATMWAVVNDEIPDPGDRRPELPCALGDVVRRALARDPGERYPTARAMREDLDRLMHEQGGAPPRLGEFLLAMFGEERARQRSDVGAPVSELSWVEPESGSEPSAPAQANVVEQETAPTVVAKHVYAPTKKRSRRAWAWIAAAVVLVLGAGGGVAAWLAGGSDRRYERAFRLAQRGSFAPSSSPTSRRNRTTRTRSSYACSWHGGRRRPTSGRSSRRRARRRSTTCSGRRSRASGSSTRDATRRRRSTSSRRWRRIRTAPSCCTSSAKRNGIRASSATAPRRCSTRWRPTRGG